MVSNILPLRVVIHPKDSFDDLLQQVSWRMHQCLRHQRYRAELSSDESGLYGTIINIMPFDYDLRFAGYPSHAHNLSLGPVAELAIAVYDRHDGSNPRIDFDANQANYTAEVLASHQVRFLGMLAQLAKSPEVSLHRLEILEPRERELLLDSFNATVRPLPEATLPELFEAQVARDPQAIAVVFGKESLTYGELNARANRLSHYLIGLGVGPESLVGIVLERSFEMIVALLATMKAGGAYLPLDPNYPFARRTQTLDDVVPALVLTSETLRTRLAQNAEVFSLDAPESQTALEQSATHNPRDVERHSALLPHHPAYVIYTSGSTGMPKGVVVTQAGISSMAGAQLECMAVSRESRVLLFASLNFDASLWEVAMALSTGATLVLLREEERSGSALRDLLLAQAVTHATLPPAVLASLEEGDDLLLKGVIVAGEACPEN